MSEQQVRVAWARQSGYTQLAGLMAETGYESWDWANDGGYFHPGESRAPDEPRGYALRAIKRELVWIGEAPAAMVDNGQYGANTLKNVRAFQTKVGLTPDGVVGPRTMKALAAERTKRFEAEDGAAKIPIPDRLVCKQIDLESAWYPAARNTTEDYGIGQIHEPLSSRFADGKPVAPGDAWEYAYRIGVNVRYVAETLRRNFQTLSKDAPALSTVEQIWRAAVFAYNAPAWADNWLAAGLPETGGEIVTVGNWRGEKYAWATLYTAAVYRRSC